MGLIDRLQHGWNAFMNKDPTNSVIYSIGQSSYRRPDRPRFTNGNDRSIITSVYNRIAIDVASNKIIHARLDDSNRYLYDEPSDINNILSTEANIDQTGRAFVQDMVQSMLDEGCIAVVPIDTDIDPDTAAFTIDSARVCKILQWYPRHVLVRGYDDRDGITKEIIVSKKTTLILENPFYAIMNERNSTAQRLIRKLALMDSLDEASSSNKMNLIFQLPYSVKSPARMQQANQRIQDIEHQLVDSKYGIAYVDSTEKVTQLNRPIENNLLEQIKYLTTELFGQLGISEEVMNGTAPEEVMRNYYNRTIEPILGCISDEIKRKWITKTARKQKQSIVYFNDPFRLAPISSIADIADKFTRNEVLSSNEVRSIVGFKPVQDPAADELRNKNLNQNDGTVTPPASTADEANYDNGYNE